MRARRTVGQIAIAGLTLLGAMALLAPLAQAAFPGRRRPTSAYGTVEGVDEIGALGPGAIEAVTVHNPQHPTVLVGGEGLKPPGGPDRRPGRSSLLLGRRRTDCVRRTLDSGRGVSIRRNLSSP